MREIERREDRPEKREEEKERREHRAYMCCWREELSHTAREILTR
jgi:hypothetical protein